MHLQTTIQMQVQNLKFALGRVENSVGKGENAGYQHFLLFLQCFQVLLTRVVKELGLCVNSTKQQNFGPDQTESFPDDNFNLAQNGDLLTGLKIL